MKLSIYIMLIVFTSCKSIHKNESHSKEISLADARLVGKLNGNSFTILFDKDDYIKAINSHLFPDENDLIDSVSIRSDFTLGDKSIKYYYLNFSSSKRNVNVVRWLNLKNRELYFDLSKNKEHPYEEYYVTCNGIDVYKPRLFFSNGKFIWSCREILGCFSPKEVCITTVTILKMPFKDLKRHFQKNQSGSIRCFS